MENHVTDSFSISSYAILHIVNPQPNKTLEIGVKKLKKHTHKNTRKNNNTHCWNTNIRKQGNNYKKNLLYAIKKPQATEQKPLKPWTRNGGEGTDQDEVGRGVIPSSGEM